MEPHGGHLGGEPGRGLASHVPQVGHRARRLRGRRRRRRRPRLLPEYRPHELGEGSNGPHIVAPHETRLGRRLCGNDRDRCCERIDQRERARYRPDRAVEPELTDAGNAVHGARRQRAGDHEDADRNGQVERRANFPHPGRREVHRDPLLRPTEPTGQQRRSDLIAGLAARRIGEADDVEGRYAAGLVDLYGDGLAVCADKDGGLDGGEHGALRGRDRRERP